MKDAIIGVDLVKRGFQVHCATLNGEVMFRKQLSREQLFAFWVRQWASLLVVFEACGSASCWMREMEALGH